MSVQSAPEPARLHRPEELVASLETIGRDFAASICYIRDNNPIELAAAMRGRRAFYHRLLDEVCSTAAMLTDGAEVR